MFGGLQHGTLLIVGERLITPDKQSCRLASLVVEENTESGMRMPVISQR